MDRRDLTRAERRALAARAAAWTRESLAELLRSGYAPDAAIRALARVNRRAR